MCSKWHKLRLFLRGARALALRNPFPNTKEGLTAFSENVPPLRCGSDNFPFWQFVPKFSRFPSRRVPSFFPPLKEKGEGAIHKTSENDGFKFFSLQFFLFCEKPQTTPFTTIESHRSSLIRSRWRCHLLPSQTCRINSCYRKEVPKKPKLPRWGFEERNLEAHFHPEQFNHCKKKNQEANCESARGYFLACASTFLDGDEVRIRGLFSSLSGWHIVVKSRADFLEKWTRRTRFHNFLFGAKWNSGPRTFLQFTSLKNVTHCDLKRKRSLPVFYFVFLWSLEPSSFPLFISLEFNCQPRHPTKCIPPKAFSGWKLRLFPRLKVEWKNGL